MSYIVIGLHEEPENFYREKGSVALVTGNLFTFLVVSSLVGLVTTQILICENQIIRRLEIPLRTIVAPLIKINCNGRFEETGKEYLIDNYCGSQRYEIYCSQLRA